jgi:hypothetical protein
MAIKSLISQSRQIRVLKNFTNIDLITCVIKKHKEFKWKLNSIFLK